jgi:hypothetical protein
MELVAKGSTDRMLAALAAGDRVEPDADARRKAEQLGNPSGRLRVPTITLHTTADPLVIAANAGVFRERVNAAKGRTGDLVPLFVAPPPKYPQQPGAPYGGGHCNFSPEQRLTVLALLDNWVRGGVYPGPGALTAAAERAPGLVTQFSPPPWPAEADG